MGISFTNILNPVDGLVKMRIDTFKDELFETPSKSFLVMYNPPTYSSEYKNKFDKPEVQGGKTIQKFKNIGDDKLNIELLFDATGASISKPNKSKSEEGATSSVTDLTDEIRGKSTDQGIKLLLDELNSIHGDEHKPRYARVVWGALIFKGVLEIAKVTHTLFKANGYPLRSKLNCTFRTHQSLKEQKEESKLTSPDLTHFQQVKGEDTLPLMSYDIYKDPNLYLELARVNRLNNFRKLRKGSRLRLPPLEK